MRTSSSLAVLALCATAVAQRHLPPPGIPITPPPVDHPAYLGQPLMPLSNGQGTVGDPTPSPRNDEDGGGGGGGGGGEGRRKGRKAGPDQTPAEQRAQEFLSQRVEGKDLRKAVACVKALPWIEDLPTALAKSAATGKPVLLVQALGEVDGFA